MEIFLVDIRIGERYIYLDGRLFPMDVRGIRFEGLFARHDLSSPPQVLAIGDLEVLNSTLAIPSYWRERALKEETQTEEPEFDREAWEKDRRRMIEESPVDVVKVQRATMEKIIHNIELNLQRMDEDDPDYPSCKESLESAKRELSWLTERLKGEENEE